MKQALTVLGGVCQPCGLWKTSLAVKVPGEGNLDTRLVLLGEALGAEEEELHRNFVGRAGGLLNSALAEAGIFREDIYILNSAQCRPTIGSGRDRKNRAPTLHEITCCRHWVDRELATLQYKQVIVAMGKWATVQALAPNEPVGGVLDNQGRVLWSDRLQCWVVCSLHPAYILRKPSELEWLVDDLMRAAVIAERGWDPNATPNIEYVVVRTLEEAFAQRDRLFQSKKLAFDWETTGLHLTKARGFCLGIWGGEGPVVVFPRKLAGGVPAFSKDDLRRLDQEVLAPLFASPIPKVGHNVSFDCNITLSTIGLFPANVVGCTMLKHQLLKNHLSERSHGLKRMSSLYLGFGHYRDAIGEWLVANGYAKDGKPDFNHLWRAPNELIWPYVATDVWATFKLDDRLEEPIQEENLGTLYTTERIPLMLEYAKMDRTGLRINKDRLDKLEMDLNEIETAVINQLQQHVGWEINPNSSQQVAKWLYVERGLPVQGRTEKGQWCPACGTWRGKVDRCECPAGGPRWEPSPSTKEEFLKLGVESEPLIELVLHARAYDKLRGAFVEGTFQEALDEDGRARFHTMLHVAETFRLVTRKPFAIHTIPRPIPMFSCPVHGKYKFAVDVQGKAVPHCCDQAYGDTLNIRGLIQPDEGHVFVTADYRQQEYALMAVASGQADLEEAILDRGEDAHEYVLQLLSGRSKKEFFDPHGKALSVELAAEYKNLRSDYKQINFMILYRGGPPKLARSLTKKNRIVDVSEATNIIFEYYERLPMVKDWQYKTIKRLRQTGRAWGLFGAYRILPGIHSADRFDQYEAERQACNFPIQNGGYHVMARGLLALAKRWRERGWEREGIARVLFSVHDEIVASVLRRRDIVEQAVQDFQDCLAQPHPELVGGCGVPRGIQIDPKVVEEWDGPAVKIS